MIDVYAIHGAFSSPRMFNYLVHRMGRSYRWHFLDYSSMTGGLDSITASISEQQRPCHVVGHSMGGLIAIDIAHRPWVCSITTISTPLGGIDISMMQGYLSRSSFLIDIASHGNYIRRIKDASVSKPIQHIISGSGFNPFIYEPNDGVVTLRSQQSSTKGTVHVLDANHIEVMLLPRTVQLLENFWTSPVL